MMISGWTAPCKNMSSGIMWTAKAQISLHIRAVWSGPSLSAKRLTGHYRMYQWSTNAQMRVWACMGRIWICAVCACSKTHFCLGRPRFKGTGKNLVTFTTYFTKETTFVNSFLLSCVPSPSTLKGRNLLPLCILGYPKFAQGRFWYDCTNVQADLNLRWGHMYESIFSDVAAYAYTYAGVLLLNVNIP